MDLDDISEVIATSILFIVIAVALGAVTGLIVMWCWNYLMPDLFGLKPLTFVQAWILTIMCSLLLTGVSSSPKK
jgi:hypothetical protein